VVADAGDVVGERVGVDDGNVATSGTWYSMCGARTTSNAPGANGSACASACTRAAPVTTASIPADRSRATRPPA
jgi:hypothetical protein